MPKSAARSSSRSPSKRPVKRGPRRNRDAEVIEAAIKVFWQKGFAAASVQDVADEVGVLKGSLYHYIDSKEDLLFRIFDESHTQASAIVKEVAATDAPPLERLRIYVERYLAWYLEHIERVSLYFSEWRHLTGARRTTVLKQRRLYEDFIRNLLREAQKADEIPAGLDLNYATFFILGGMQSVPVWYSREGRDSPQQIATVFAAMTIGVITGTEPPKSRRR
jgi:AcrR family transcriptional regulator